MQSNAFTCRLHLHHCTIKENRDNREVGAPCCVAFCVAFRPTPDRHTMSQTCSISRQHAINSCLLSRVLVCKISGMLSCMLSEMLQINRCGSSQVLPGESEVTHASETWVSMQSMDDTIYSLSVFRTYAFLRKIERKPFHHL